MAHGTTAVFRRPPSGSVRLLNHRAEIDRAEALFVPCDGLRKHVLKTLRMRRREQDAAQEPAICAVNEREVDDEAVVRAPHLREVRETSLGDVVLALDAERGARRVGVVGHGATDSIGT